MAEKGERPELIYVACPYSHDDPCMLEYRFHKVNHLVARLMVKYPDKVFFSPISHSHPIAQYMGNHLDGKHWLKQDLAILELFDEVWVYMLDGWEDSDGVYTEMVEALKFGKTIMYVGDNAIVEV